MGYKENGHPIYLTIGYFHTKSEGLAALTKFNDTPCLSENYNMTLAKMFEKWQEEKFKSVEKGSVSAYKTSFNNVKVLHDMKMREIKHTDIQPIINERFANKFGAAANIKKMFNQLFKYAISIDVCNKNYATFVILPKAEEKVKRHIFTDEEITWLFNNTDKRGAKQVLIMIYTSMRIAELLTQDVNNIFIDDRHMIGGVKTDAGKNRVIPISKKIEPFIRELMLEGNLCPTLNGKSMTYNNFRDNIFLPLMAEMNAEHTIHDCRHTAVTLMRKAGIEPLYIKLIAGHVMNDITEKVYTHVPPERLVAEIDKL